MTAALAVLRRQIPRNGLRRQAAILVGGTAVGQGITVLAAPVLTRIYAPDDFGVLAVFVSVVGIVSVVASARYELAIPLPEEEGTAQNLLALSLLLALAATAITGVGLALFGPALMRFLGAPRLQPYLWLLPLSTLAAGCCQCLAMWATRQRDFGRIAGSKIAQGAAQALAQVLSGLARSSPAGLLMGDAIGRMAAACPLVLPFWPLSGGRVSLITRHGMLEAGRRFRDFPRLSTGAALLNNLAVTLPALLMAARYRSTTAGLFALGHRVLFLPLSLISKSVSQVYLGEAARLACNSPRELRRLLHLTVRRLFLIGLVPMSVIAIGGPWLFRVLFGSAWAEAGAFARILAPTGMTLMAMDSVSHTLNLLECQGWQLAWDAGRAALVVGSLLGAALLGWTARGALSALAVSMVVSDVALFVLADLAVRRRIEAMP